MFRRCILGLILVVLCATSVTFASVDYTTQADELKILGLFSGTDKGYELERAPKRIEGAAMLVRLLGKEEEAKAKMYPHPFKDVPSWANAHIGYMFHHKLTAGVSADRFDSDAFMTGNAYATFVLRALGYDDKIGDFKWDQALSVAVTKGIISASEMGNMEKGFKRNEMVGLSRAALNANMKEENKTLIYNLLDNGAVTLSNVFKTSVQVSSESLNEVELTGVLNNTSTNFAYYTFKDSDLIDLVGEQFYLYRVRFSVTNDTLKFMQNSLYISSVNRGVIQMNMEANPSNQFPNVMSFYYSKGGAGFMGLYDKNMQLRYYMAVSDIVPQRGQETIKVIAREVPQAWSSLYKSFDQRYDAAFSKYESTVKEYPKSVLEFKKIESLDYLGKPVTLERLYIVDPELIKKVAYFTSGSDDTPEHLLKQHLISNYINEVYVFENVINLEKHVLSEGYPLNYGGRFILILYDHQKKLIGYINLNK